MSSPAALRDPFLPGASLIHRLDARVKLPLTLGFILCTALIPSGSWAVFPLFWALLLSVTLLSGFRFSFLLSRSLLALPFLLAALPLLFTPQKAETLIPFAGTLLLYSPSGAERFFSIALKTWLSVQAAILLTATTPMTNLLLALRALHVPQLLVAIVSLMWRYLFLITNEAGRLMRARASRSSRNPSPAHRSGGRLVWRGQVTGGMAGSLFLRSYERSERVYSAMLARGYDGEIRSFAIAPLNRLNKRILFFGFLVLLFCLSFGILLR